MEHEKADSLQEQMRTAERGIKYCPDYNSEILVKLTCDITGENDKETNKYCPHCNCVVLVLVKLICTKTGANGNERNANIVLIITA